MRSFLIAVVGYRPIEEALDISLVHLPEHETLICALRVDEHLRVGIVRVVTNVAPHSVALCDLLVHSLFKALRVAYSEISVGSFVVPEAELRTPEVGIFSHFLGLVLTTAYCDVGIVGSADLDLGAELGKLLFPFLKLSEHLKVSRLVYGVEECLFEPNGISLELVVILKELCFVYRLILVFRNGNHERGNAWIGHIYVCSLVKNVERKVIAAHIVVKDIVIPLLVVAACSYDPGTACTYCSCEGLILRKCEVPYVNGYFEGSEDLFLSVLELVDVLVIACGGVFIGREFNHERNDGLFLNHNTSAVVGDRRVGIVLSADLMRLFKREYRGLDKLVLARLHREGRVLQRLVRADCQLTALGLTLR